MKEDSSKNNEEEKSQEGENEEDEDESIYMEIKKETSKIVHLDNKTYQKLITQLVNTNEMIKKIKEKSFISSNNSNINNKDSNKENNISNISNNILEKKDQEINKLTNENEQYKKEILLLKSMNADSEKKYDELKTKYEKEINEKNELINSLQKDLDNMTLKYNELNDKLSLEQKKNYYNINIEKILNDDKLVEKITNYLPIEDTLKISSLNKKMHFYYKYKNKYLELQKNYLQSQNLLAEITSEDILSKYGIEDEELQNIISKYTNNHIISGNPMRYRIFHSLTFLENIVRKPLLEQYDENIEKDTNKEKKKDKAKGLFNDLFSGKGKNGENEVTNIIKKKKIKENLERKMITMDFDLNYADLKKLDEEFKKKLNKDELINIKFEFNSAEEIKNLMRFFLKVGLDENYYTKFRSYLIDEFAELLFNCNSCLKCIKELEICNKIQGIRFSKNIYLIKQMTNEIDNLKSFNDSNKKIKDKLMKQKNELEVKYNDSLMKNSSLNKTIVEDEKKIVDLEEEKRKMEEEIQTLKKKIVNDYKIIENKYNLVNGERNLLINIFLEMKNFFRDKIESLVRQENI